MSMTKGFFPPDTSNDGDVWFQVTPAELPIFEGEPDGREGNQSNSQ